MSLFHLVLAATVVGAIGDGAQTARVLPPVETVAKLLSMNCEDIPAGSIVDVGGYFQPDDGGGGRFRLEKEPARRGESIDNGIIFAAAGDANWRWRRIREGSTINILWYGARRDGSEDCADLVRRAARQGDVYYPEGTYLQSHVDVRSRRKYFGDGPGRTVIKRAIEGGHDRIVFGIATSDFDGSGHVEGDIEHVVIRDMTLDFNLVNGWVNRPLIQLRNGGDSAIRDVTIENIHFVDSAKVPHPNVFGKPGGDAWCINATAQNVERLTVSDCVSTALTHQFIAGGGSMRGIRYVNNEIHGGWANGISMTTVGFPARFEDVEISGNRIYGTATGSIYVGYDYGHERPTGPFQMRDIRIRDNLIVLDESLTYGNKPVTDNFPSAVQVFGGSGGVENLTISGNSLRVGEAYSGGDVNFLKLAIGDFEMDPAATGRDFGQPDAGVSVSVAISPENHSGEPWAVPGCMVAIGGAGYFEIVTVDGSEVELTPVSWFPMAPAGATIPAGAQVQVLGGLWKQILVANNNADQRYLIQGVTFDDLTITGNVIDSAIRFSNCRVRSLNLSGNSSLAASATSSNLAGLIADNTIWVGNTFTRGALHFDVSKDPFTGLDERCDVVVSGNALISNLAETPNDVAVRIQGDAKDHGIRLMNNVFEGSTIDDVIDTIRPEAEDGGPKSENGGRRTEVGDQKPEDGGPKAEETPTPEGKD